MAAVGSGRISTVSDSDKVFLDANILVYALDSRYPNKRKRAAEVLRSVQDRGGGVISTQVLQECYVAATTKLGIEPLTAKEALVKLKALELVLVDFALIQDAIDTSILNRISFWDALIVVSAAKAACAELLTEDLNDGQVIRGVRIRNPFKMNE
jgi:predicted nucleic acid-binding protein